MGFKVNPLTGKMDVSGDIPTDISVAVAAAQAAQAAAESAASTAATDANAQIAPNVQDAVDAKNAAEHAQADAEHAQADSEHAASDAAQSAIDADTAYDNAVIAQNAAAQSAIDADTAYDNAVIAKNAAEQAAIDADTAYDNAVIAKNAAEHAQADAEHAQADAEAAQLAAENAAASIALPTPTTGDAGKAIVVNSTEDGWDLSDTPAGGGGITFTEVTSNTTTAVNNGYIANKATTATEFTLPATSAVGDMLELVGKGTSGWVLKTNATATAQQVLWKNYESVESDSSAVQVMYSVLPTDACVLVCTVANSVWTVANAEGCGFGNYFGNATDGDVTISTDTSLTVLNKNGSYDGDMVVRNYNNLTVNSSCTLTTDQPCRGLLIYCKGNLVVNGTITMTARGAFAEPTGVDAGGLVIKRIKSGETSTNPDVDLLGGCGDAAQAAENFQPPTDGNGKNYVIAKVGAAGGASQGSSASGIAGSSGAALTGTGGGGSGGSLGYYSGAGAAGTCFSGGAGGSGCYNNTQAAGEAGGDYGGRGGDYNGIDRAGGGAGNPGGQGQNATAESGTGGLLIIIVRGNVTLGGSGLISANGKKGSSNYLEDTGGGSSGGGTVIVLYAGTMTLGGTIQAIGGVSAAGYGGSNGGAGGAGYCVYEQINA